MMVEELYEALIEAGASPEKARNASRALADYHDRFERIERKLIEHDGKFTLLQWMLGTVIALCLAILFRVFS